ALDRRVRDARDARAVSCGQADSVVRPRAIGGERGSLRSGTLVAAIVAAPRSSQIPPGHPGLNSRNLLSPRYATHAPLRPITSEHASVVLAGMRRARVCTAVSSPESSTACAASRNTRIRLL